MKENKDSQEETCKYMEGFFEVATICQQCRDTLPRGQCRIQNEKEKEFLQNQSNNQ